MPSLQGVPRTRTTSRRRFLSGVAGAGVALCVGQSSSFAAQRRPPNVVMIVGDDMGWTDFGFMGHQIVRTPRIDRLAKESAVFPNGYVPTSLCRASLATLLTGQYPHQHRICCNDPPAGVDRTEMHPFIKTAPTIPRLLGQAGYRSLQTGKFWEGHFSNAGFTHGETTNSDRHIAMKPRPQIGRDTLQPIYDFVDDNRERPFYIWYAPMMPHYPHTPPERILKRYKQVKDENIAKYYAMCEWFDETCGQVLDHLDKRRLTDNTLVLFCIDNGWIQPRVGEEKKRSPFGSERGKRSPYDGGIRTSVFIRWPGHSKPGTYSDLVSTIDFAPTIMSACGVKIPEAMHGVSLLDAAAGTARLKRDAIFGEIYVHTATKLGAPDLDVTHRWVRAGEWKLIVFLKEKTVELFNIARDPHEKNNLAAKEPDRVKHLRGLVEQWVRKR